MNKDHNIAVLKWHRELKEDAEKAGLEHLANIAKYKIIQTQELIYPDVKYAEETANG